MSLHGKQHLKRRTSNKRWSDAEVKLLLEFMLQHEEIEKPTAQVFYKKLIKATGIDASWNLLRWKVKGLKTTYLKALSWRKTAEAIALESEFGFATVQDKMRKICRFYDELHTIYGKKYLDYPPSETFKNNVEFINIPAAETALNEKLEFCGFESSDDCRSTSAATQSAEYTTHITDCFKVETDVMEAEASSPAPAPAAIPVSQRTLPPTATQPKKQKISVQKFAVESEEDAMDKSLNQLAVVQSERNEFLKLKIEFEREKFKKEFELKEKEFEESVNERKANLELKVLEMEKEERLRILELEKQERIERLEIEMRYKYGFQNRE